MAANHTSNLNPAGNGARRGIHRQAQLSFAKSVRIAWQGIRARMGRSLLVISGIVLALAFLSHILSSEILTRSMATAPAPHDVAASAEPETAAVDAADARIQTRWMVGLALMIAFVGILNAMLLSVTERFREIGTMKCLGALDSLIVRLFLLESLFQGFLGAVVGTLTGISLAVAQAAIANGAGLWNVLPVGALLRVAATCLVLGVGLTVCGALYPAWRAARMQPVAALRSEI